MKIANAPKTLLLWKTSLHFGSMVATEFRWKKFCIWNLTGIIPMFIRSIIVNILLVLPSKFSKNVFRIKPFYASIKAYLSTACISVKSAQ